MVINLLSRVQKFFVGELSKHEFYYNHKRFIIGWCGIFNTIWINTTKYKNKKQFVLLLNYNCGLKMLFGYKLNK